MLRLPPEIKRAQFFRSFATPPCNPKSNNDILCASRPSRVMCESASANRAGTPRWRNDDGPFGEKCSRWCPSGKDGRLSSTGKVLTSNDRQQTKKRKKRQMSNKFEKGNVYDFAFSRVAFWNGVRYIVLKDSETGSETIPGYEDTRWTFRVHAKPFQCEWDNGCEWPEFRCRVTGFIKVGDTETAFPQLAQDRAFVNERLYSEANADEPLRFEVVKLEESGEAPAKVTLRDPATDLWYFFSSNEFQEEEITTGQSVNVFPSRNKKGEVCFTSATMHEKNMDNPSHHKSTPRESLAKSSIPVDNLLVLNLPSSGESKYAEYKSSLVYPAGEKEPDVDKQLGQVIVRAVASFMNSDGGCVYVGVRDNGEVCGIESEVAFLNDNSEDTTQYKQSMDGIQLKILNVIRQKLGDAAGSLVDVRFKQGLTTKHLVCEIVVRANETDIPVYADGKHLYVRYSGQTQRLEGEAAAKFIIDRLRRLDMKRSGQKGIDSAVAIEAMMQLVSKSLVTVQTNGVGK